MRPQESPHLQQHKVPERLLRGLLSSLDGQGVAHAGMLGVPSEAGTLRSYCWGSSAGCMSLHDWVLLGFMGELAALQTLLNVPTHLGASMTNAPVNGTNQTPCERSKAAASVYAWIYLMPHAFLCFPRLGFRIPSSTPAVLAH